MLKRDGQAASLRMTLCAGLEEELSGEQSYLYFGFGEPG